MAKLSGIELKRARLVPSSVFASPDQVVSSAELSRAQKIAILRRWEFDVRGRESGALAIERTMLNHVHDALTVLGVVPPGGHRTVLTRH